MSAKTLRILSVVCWATAAVISLLNLHRVANLGVKTLPLVFIVMGIAFMAASRRRAVR